MSIVMFEADVITSGRPKSFQGDGKFRKILPSYGGNTNTESNKHIALKWGVLHKVSN